MKNLLAAIVLLICTIAAYAENSNAILFTENGERFKVVLNGVLQNATPETNVKLTDLPAPNYKCRIIFEDTKLGYVDFNMFFPNQGYEVTWNIKKNNKGEYVVRYVSDVLIADALPAPPAQSEFAYTTVPATTTTTTTVQQQQSSVGSGGGENFNLSISVNDNNQGGSISMNATGMDGGMQQSGYSSTTTTTTHTVTTTTGNVPPPPPASAPVVVVYVPGYTGKTGCPIPINQNEFSQMKETIRSKTFEETKLTISKQILKDNCVTSSQVRDILNLFDFESTKLDFAKFAYARTYDIGNYYKVNDAFEFESSVDELNDYISGK